MRVRITHTTRTMNARIAAAAVVCCAVATIVAQDIRVPSIPPRFTATIDYVAVNARVLDRDGRPVRDLTQDDFSVFEDGVRQAISTFSVVDIPEPPRSRAATAPVAAGVRPDVATNTRVNRHGRTYLILLDSFAIDPGRTLVVRKFLRDFIERSIGPGDLVAISSTGRDRAYENFTGDKPRLLAAVGRMVGQSEGSPTVADALDITNRALAIGPDSGGFARSPPVADGTTIDTRMSQRRLAQLVHAMSSGGEGSRAIILVSESLPFEIVSNTEGLSLFGELNRVAAEARQGNVPIYPIDPRGLTSGGEDAIQIPGTGDVRSATPPILDEVRRAHDRL